MVILRRFRWILAPALGGWLLMAPAAGAQLAGPLAPAPAAWHEVALDAALASAASAAVLGLAIADGGRGPLGAAGAIGQFALVAGVAAVPPAALVGVGGRPHPVESYTAALPGGLLGLALGFAATRSLGWPAPGPTEAAIQVAAMALGQGLGSAAAYHLYQRYRPEAEGLNQLPEDADRTDDPIRDWNLRRERQNP